MKINPFDAIINLYYQKNAKKKAYTDELKIDDLLNVVSKIGNDQLVVNLTEKIEEVITPELIEECFQEVDLRKKLKVIIKRNLEYNLNNDFASDISNSIDDIKFEYNINPLITKNISSILKDTIEKITIENQ